MNNLQNNHLTRRIGARTAGIGTETSSMISGSLTNGAGVVVVIGIDGTVGSTEIGRCTFGTI